MSNDDPQWCSPKWRQEVVTALQRKGFRHDAAEEACQDAYVSLLQKPQLIASARNPKALTITVAYRKAIDATRKKRPICETDLHFASDAECALLELIDRSNLGL